MAKRRFDLGSCQDLAVFYSASAVATKTSLSPYLRMMKTVLRGILSRVFSVAKRMVSLEIQRYYRNCKGILLGHRRYVERM